MTLKTYTKSAKINRKLADATDMEIILKSLGMCFRSIENDDNGKLTNWDAKAYKDENDNLILTLFAQRDENCSDS